MPALGPRKISAFSLSSLPALDFPALHTIVGSVRCGSPLDPIPPVIFKSVLETLAQPLLALHNTSLATSHVPAELKQAVVTSLLKKTGG